MAAVPAGYFTLIAAALLACPPHVTTSGFVPLLTPAGTVMLACARPT